jgi:protein-S-isoprenylcysteine O-methyltransferase Ste14
MFVMNTQAVDFLLISSLSWLILMLYWLYSGMKTKMTIQKQNPGSRWIHLLMVSAAFALVFSPQLSIGFLSYRLLPASRAILYSGLAINVAGIVFAILARSWLGTNWSAIVTVKQGHELITNGPYALSRHPIYTGMLFGLIGSAMVLGEIRGLIGVILFLLAILKKMQTEEKFMRSTFEAYEKYSRQTSRLIPFIY